MTPVAGKRVPNARNEKKNKKRAQKVGTMFWAVSTQGSDRFAFPGVQDLMIEIHVTYLSHASQCSISSRAHRPHVPQCPVFQLHFCFFLGSGLHF